MDVSRCVRKTVQNDKVALPSIQVYLDSHGRVWHDLAYVCQCLAPMLPAALGRKANFYRDCGNYWRRAQLPDGHAFFRTADMRETTRVSCCSTYALYSIVLGAVAIGRISEDSTTKLLSIFEHLCKRIESVINRCPCTIAGQSPFAGFPNLRICMTGTRVNGVWQSIQALPRQSQICLRSAWHRMYTANKLLYASLENE